MHYSTRQSSAPLLYTLAILTAIFLGSCGEGVPVPADHLVEAYSEILIASNINREDSVRRGAVLDSIAANFGFSDHKKVLAEIHEMTLDPDVLRKVLDSTQNRLQSLQQASNAKGLK